MIKINHKITNEGFVSAKPVMTGGLHRKQSRGFGLPYHVPALLDQEIPKPLDNSLQDRPSNPVAWLDGYDMDRRTIAQIIVERVFGLGKRSIAASLDLELTIPVNFMLV